MICCGVIACDFAYQVLVGRGNVGVHALKSIRHGGDVDNDPYQIWHSDSAKAGGSNFVSYKNNQVDQWIELGRKELDSKKRARWWKKVYRQIAEDAPYTFMFSPKYFLYGHRQKVKMKRSTLRYDEGDLYWWLTSPNL